MENYSNFGLALVGGFMFFSATIFVSCVCYLRQKKELVDDVEQQLSDEIGSFHITLQEIASERDLLRNGLDQRFEQLYNWKSAQTPTPTFFKPEHKQQATLMNEQLQELHGSLISGLKNYPEFNSSEAVKISCLAGTHRQYQEHHAYVGEVAAKCFEAFDNYLHHLNDSTKESNNMFTV